MCLHLDHPRSISTWNQKWNLDEIVSVLHRQSHLAGGPVLALECESVILEGVL